MKIFDAGILSVANLKRAKMRSMLTMLGIVIGIASVIILVSVGSSAQKLILDQVQGIGSNLVFVVPVASKDVMDHSAQLSGVPIKTLKDADVYSLRGEPSVKYVLPQITGQSRAIYENEDISVTYQGVDHDFFEVRNFRTTSGTVFSNSDVGSFSRVAVIGSKLAEELFNAQNPIGKQIRLKGFVFTVIGVLEKKGLGPMGVDQDKMVLIPITVAQKQLLGIDYYHMLTIEADPEFDMEYVKSRVISILRTEHRITNPDKDDFIVRTQEDALSLLGNITNIMTIFLAAIASISLIVGGIGIMNIMLVSVSERTREIGLRKAVGATNKDILLQFLTESSLLTLIGGLVGILFGSFVVALMYFVLSKVLDGSTGWFFSLPAYAILTALAVSVGTGLLFGVYPARKASKKNPIDALRYE